MSFRVHAIGRRRMRTKGNWRRCAWGWRDGWRPMGKRAPLYDTQAYAGGSLAEQVERLNALNFPGEGPDYLGRRSIRDALVEVLSRPPGGAV